MRPAFAKRLGTALLIVVLGACADATGPSPHLVQSGPTAAPSTSGLDAYQQNARLALLTARLGDSTGLRALATLETRRRLLSGLFSNAVRTPGGTRSAELTGTETTVYTESGGAQIYSSDTWPASLAESGGSIGSYVLFLGTAASSTADYKVAPIGDRSADWASAGTNSSSPRSIYSLSDCFSQGWVACAWTKQQDANFSVTGVASCGVTFSARGNHEVWFDTGFDISVSNGTIGLSFHVNNPAAHATQANGEKSMDTSNCGDNDDYTPLEGGGGDQCPEGHAYEWYHFDGSEWLDMGEVCL